jgi:hypothetical protein
MIKKIVTLATGLLFSSLLHAADRPVPTASKKPAPSGKLKDPANIERAIGKLQKKHPRAVRLYSLSHESGTRAILRDEQRHAAATTLPLNTGTFLRIRKPSQPDAEQ